MISSSKMRGRADRLFHTLVVVGASLQGCGGKAAQELASVSQGGGAGASDSGAAAGAAGKSLMPSDCVTPADFTCSDYAALTACFCNPNAPQTRADCADPFEFQCHAFEPSPPPSPNNGQIQINSPVTLYVGCSCTTPLLRPESCSTPEAFFCARTEPDFADCRCDPASVCTSEQPCCQSAQPRFGCGCCPVPIK
jgi:hypothetical protein